ncbi:MAG: type I phosphomannose isomerase catalytic subunit [Christensenellales bacterium]|uniref:Class I mannose-6-phosphate isomerase n=1 Tax=Candidatus Avichristensenella intestinipullorum TaxID=2840693 RepID=A0A9D1CJ09_9FIRM|nr:type I phosphomannose isomerase catalytic subunit [Christensenellales bacterium]HIQ62898.1 class I mannose-6-phosphate isomerase [Candidatus Avichristensenella intestinipullorum]
MTTERFAYPLLPAFRHGAQTPWGGDALARLFHKAIPDARTGEAMEASTLEGLESRLEDGRPLSALTGGPLPLLLKLLDAREPLSVQVHPDDAYAAAHEGGRQGKAEAWVILHAEPGARLVYGLLPGSNPRAAGQAALERCLRWVTVQAGDVLYIPAGMVHAIGGGLVLYEIQQASDITYRFWDWGRLGADGRPRELHWEKACDVARAGLQLSPLRPRMPKGGGVVRCLETPHFTLDRAYVRGETVLAPCADFRFFTALGEGALAQNGVRIPVRAGQTLYVPATERPIRALGQFDALISAPAMTGT